MILKVFGEIWPILDLKTQLFLVGSKVLHENCKVCFCSFLPRTFSGFKSYFHIPIFPLNQCYVLQWLLSGTNLTPSFLASPQSLGFHQAAGLVMAVLHVLGFKLWITLDNLMLKPNSQYM